MVGARGRSLREPLSCCRSPRSGIALPLTGGVQQEWECDGSGAPPPKTPNPPQTTCPNPWCRGRCARETSQRHLNASSTQPGLACLGAGGGGGSQRVAQAGHGGNTPLTPQVGTYLEAEVLGITRRNRVAGSPLVGDRIGMIGAPCAHSLSMEAGGVWMRQGGSKEASGLNRVGVLYPNPK